MELERLTGQYALLSPLDQGELHLVRRGAFLHVEGVRTGIAMPWAGRLVMAFGPLNKVEIGAYQIAPAGVTAGVAGGVAEGVGGVTGLWVPPGADQSDFSACGVERSIPQPDGTWKISHAYAIDKSEYAGHIHRIPFDVTASLPRALKMHWQLEDGDFHSFAIEYADALYATFSFEPEKPHGIAVFEPPAGERAWRGYSLSLGQAALTTETLTRLR